MNSATTLSNTHSIQNFGVTLPKPPQINFKFPRSFTSPTCILLAGVSLLSSMTRSKAQGSEASPLVANAVVQTISPSLTNTKLELPHIQQRSGTPLCGPAVVLTAYQRETGLRLINPRVVERLGAIVAKPGHGASPAWLYSPLNFNFSEFNFLENYKVEDLRSARVLALDTLRKEIIPQLEKGAFFSFSVSTGFPASHAILLTNYDSKTDKITVHDPLLKNATDMTVAELANKWPFKYQDVRFGRYYHLRAAKLEFSPLSELRDPPENASVNISRQALEKLNVLEELSPVMINNAQGSSLLAQNTAWKHLSHAWEDRNPTSILGVADIVRIKVAQGEPPLMLFNQGDNIRVVVVSGYRGGYCNPKGQIQLTMLHEGKLYSEWLSVSDFLQKCSPRQGDGRYGCYIGYPKTTLRDPLQDLSSITIDQNSLALNGSKASLVSLAPPSAIRQRRVMSGEILSIEGESLVSKARPSAGTVESQTLTNISNASFSAGAHLWWKDTKIGDSLKLELDTKGMTVGVYDIHLYPTTANDYAIAKISINGQEKTVDLFSEQVLPGKPLVFRNIAINKTDVPLEITTTILNKNGRAAPGFMVGIDRIEIEKSVGALTLNSPTPVQEEILGTIVRLEGEALVPKAKANAGQIILQNLPATFSGSAQLWWRDAKIGDTLQMEVDTKDLKSGNYELSLYPTTARDYAIVKVVIDGKEQTRDLFSKDLAPGEPLLFEDIKVTEGVPIQISINITDKNKDAVPSFMVGVDRIEMGKSITKVASVTE